MNERREHINELLRQLFNQAQTPRDQAMAVGNAHNEYQIIDENSIRDNELAGHIGNAPEIDLNSQRNLVKPHTFWR
jgi:hypothetical protein